MKGTKSVPVSVILVDDEPGAYYWIEQHCLLRGVKFTCCASVDQAWDALTTTSYDVAIIDMLARKLHQ